MARTKKLPARARTPRNNALIGLILVLVAIFGLILAYTKHVPFTSRGFELKADFNNPATLRVDSPVRIAGVNVGKVISVDPKGNDMAEVTFTVADDGLPVNSDAQVTVRPRLFLEGNFFLDVQPGSPSAANLSSGDTIPVTNTQTAVQLDQILTALQKPERANLQKLLEGYGTALVHKPTPAEDKTQDPLVHGVIAASALNDSFHYADRAARNSAITAEALQGTAPHDLSELIDAQAHVFGVLAARESQLTGLISNFNTFAGALAAESTNLSATVAELAPTLEETTPALRALNSTFPPLREYAVVAKPGVEELGPTINAGLPWLRQTKLLLRQSELGGVAQDLASSAPHTATAVNALKGFLPQLRLTGQCISGVLSPAGNVVLNDPNFGTGQPNYREFLYGLVGLAGEAQEFDGNGSFLRVQSSGGPNLVKTDNPNGGVFNATLWGNTISDPNQMGVQPAYQSQGKPPFKTGRPCYQNGVPDLNGPAAQVAPSDFTPVP
jgi:phospholipid/cholesterol/gamma-HCH transport system substrate-binding protein